ncbi:hypothetical protein V1508DRAFT_429293 [Lipomyces doorenjongii]|uniref:uncharacterized protein n=1 Tax=Lipomyces doorenjongii TaxID=383834 RepID=UPI0034CE53AA
MFLCSQCSHSPFSNKRSLNKHVSDYHRVAPNSRSSADYVNTAIGNYGGLLCKHCGAKISTLSNLTRHIKRSCKGIHPQAQRDHTVDQSGSQSNGGVGTNVMDCTSLDDIRMTYDPRWNILICQTYCYVVDKALVIDHLLTVHKLRGKDELQIGRTLALNKLRAHLVDKWDHTIDVSEAEYNETNGFVDDVFTPGSPAIGIPVQDGFKCSACESQLVHRCVQAKDALRTHYRPHHHTTELEFRAVRVQAIYGRSSRQHQLRYVEVIETAADDDDIVDYVSLGIPSDVHSAPPITCRTDDSRDIHMFGKNFFAYQLLENLKHGGHRKRSSATKRHP